MNFQNPGMYWAFLLIALPVLLHFIFKRRYQTFAFGAMTVLRLALAKRKDRILLEQILMIGTRAIALACLAAALLHPVLGDKAASAEGEDRSCMVLLFDNSASMLAGEGLSRFERVRFAGANLMDSLRSGDEAFIVPAASPDRIAAMQPFRDPDDAKAAVQALEPSWKPRDLPAAVLAASELFAKSPHQRRDLFIFTDPQALGFGHEQEARWQPVVDALDQLDPPPRIFWVEPGMNEHWGESSDNLSLRPPSVSSSVVHAGEPLILKVRVGNSGQAIERADVTMTLDGEARETRRISLEAGGEAVARFSCLLPEVGPHRLSFQVETDKDLLAEDDSILHAVKAEQRLPVLLVDGNLTPEPLHNESDLARYALNPPALGDEANMPYEVAVASAPELHLMEHLGKRFSSILFLNVFEPDEALVNRLEQYVAAGGGLMLVLGDRVDRGYYNKHLYRDGRGLLPCELLAKGGDEADLEKHETPLIVDEGHPALLALARGEAPLDHVRIHAWHRVRVPPHLSETRTVLSLQPSNDPLLLARPFGRGTLYVLTTGLNLKWSNFPIHPSYQLLVRGLADSLTAPRLLDLNLEVGQPLYGQFAFERRGAEHTLSTPAEASHQLAVRRKFGLDTVNFEGTAAPGWYELRSDKDGISEHSSFAVNPDPRESDLTAVDRGLREGIAARIGAQRVSGWDDLEGSFRRARRGLELWWIFLAGVVAFAALEIVLGRLFTRSFVDRAAMGKD